MVDKANVVELLSEMEADESCDPKALAAMRKCIKDFEESHQKLEQKLMVNETADRLKTLVERTGGTITMAGLDRAESYYLHMANLLQREGTKVVIDPIQLAQDVGAHVNLLTNEVDRLQHTVRRAMDAVLNAERLLARGQKAKAPVEPLQQALANMQAQMANMQAVPGIQEVDAFVAQQLGNRPIFQNEPMIRARVQQDFGGIPEWPQARRVAVPRVPPAAGVEMIPDLPEDEDNV